MLYPQLRAEYKDMSDKTLRDVLAHPDLPKRIAEIIDSELRARVLARAKPLGQLGYPYAPRVNSGGGGTVLNVLDDRVEFSGTLVSRKEGERFLRKLQTVIGLLPEEAEVPPQEREGPPPGSLAKEGDGP